MNEKDNEHGERYDDKDDEEGAKGPPEVELVEEDLGDLGTGERRAEAGGRVQGEDNHTVLESGDVGHEDVDDEAEGNLSNPPEDLRGRVHLDAVASGLHDHANDDEDERPDKPFHAAPEIDNLSHAEGDDTADNSRGNADDREEAVLRERGGDVWRQRPLDGAEHVGDETYEP